MCGGASRGITYLVALSLSLALLAIVAIDAMRRVPPNGQPLTSRREPIQNDSDAALQAPALAVAAPPVVSSPTAAGTSAPQAVLPPVSGPAHPPPRVVPAWPPAMVQVSTVAGRAAVPLLPRESGVTAKACLATWDRDTHMTTEEWKAACQRATAQP
jgi:hypothetical protein